MDFTITIQQFVPLPAKTFRGKLTLTGPSDEETSQMAFEIERKLNAMSKDTVAIRAHISESVPCFDDPFEFVDNPKAK